MLFSVVLDSEVIDNNRALYWSPFVLPKTRYKFALVVSVFIEPFFQELIGEQYHLWEPVHDFDGGNVDGAVSGYDVL